MTQQRTLAEGALEATTPIYAATAGSHEIFPQLLAKHRYSKRFSRYLPQNLCHAYVVHSL
jgi:hypothetical protein